VPSPRVVFAATALLLAMVWFGSRPQIVLNPTTGLTAQSIDPNDLPVLENYDILANFEPLTELPPPVQADADEDQPDS
jgi:hypothetical protein